MGIYDRDYYRREGPSYLDSFSVRGQIVAWILGINVALFLLQVATREPTPGRSWRPGVVTETLQLHPQKVMSGEVWRLLTYAFIHDDGTGRDSSSFWTHIFFNMWLFFLFGGMVEELYGRWEFLSFYLAASVLGGLAYMAGSLTTLQGGLDVPCLGASGAVTATLVLAAFHYPNRTIMLFFVLPVPLWAMAVFHVAQDTLGLLSGREGVAFSVHLGGAAFAFMYHRLQFRFISLLPSWRSWKLARNRRRFRVYRGEEETPEPVPVGVPETSDVDEQLEAKVDAVLAKVARSGKDSLTEQEHQLLLKASEIYKRRRS